MSLKILQDTSIYGPRQYYVEGYPEWKFTLKKDAENAFRLARFVRIQTLAEVRITIDDLTRKPFIGE